MMNSKQARADFLYMLNCIDKRAVSPGSYRAADRSAIQSYVSVLRSLVNLVIPEGGGEATGDVVADDLKAVESMLQLLTANILELRTEMMVVKGCVCASEERKETAER